MRRSALLLAGLAFLVLGQGAAQARWEDPNEAFRKMRDRLLVRVGGFSVHYDTDLRFGSSVLLGTSINLEDALDLESRATELRIDGHWRFGTKRRLRFTVFDLDRSGLSVIDEDIEIDDTVYLVGALLDSRLRTGFLKADYTWSLVNKDRVDTGFSVGLSVVDLFFGGRGAGAAVDDNRHPLWVGSGEGEFDFTAPVPVVGQHIRLALGKRVFYNGALDLFFLRTSEWRMSLIDLRAGIDWFFTKHVGLSVLYNFVRIEYDSDDGSKAFDVDYRVDGLVFQLAIAF